MRDRKPDMPDHYATAVHDLAAVRPSFADDSRPR
jgi:hypothetical protein